MPLDLLLYGLLCLTGYASGSILFAPLVCRWLNAPPPHLYGSGNPGASNVYRIAGPGPAFWTLMGDALKGFLPVLLAQQLNTPPGIQALVALSAILGHMVPIFTRLPGGKGVATTLGAGLALSASTLIAAAVLWSWLLRRYRIPSLASIITALATPLLAWLFARDLLPVFVAISALMLFRHRDNLIRLLRGTEAPL